MSEWRRISPWMIVVRPLHEVVGVLPVLLAFVLLGRGDPQQLAWSGGVLVLLLGRGLVLWWRTSYRVGQERVELHTGLFGRRERALLRDRVRTVERTARFGHRLFGLAEVHIGTGQQETRLQLDGVTSAEADRLRAELLRRAPAGGEAAGSAPEESEADSGAVLASLDWKWLRYAPLTLSGIASLGVGAAASTRILNEVNDEGDWVAGLAQWFGSRLSRYSLAADVVGGLIALALLVTVVSLAGYAVSYAGYVLTRQPDGTLRVRRGLLTARSVAIEEARLRGLRMRQEPLLRAARGARLSAITSGLGRRSESGLLVPPAPLDEVHRIGAEVGHAAESPVAVPLTGHPRAALRRRLVRSVGAVLVVAALAGGLRAWGPWPDWPWITALCLLPLAAVLALDRYRALGHALDDRWLVSRSGALRRDTDALHRSGVIGWKVHRSFFQRRSGLLTLEPTTASAHARPLVVDIDEQEGLELAGRAVPHLLDHLTVRD